MRSVVVGGGSEEPFGEHVGHAQHAQEPRRLQRHLRLVALDVELDESSRERDHGEKIVKRDRSHVLVAAEQRQRSHVLVAAEQRQRSQVLVAADQRQRSHVLVAAEQRQR